MTQPSTTPSMYERIGGQEPLRAIVRDFVQRVYKDMIIGFFFEQIEQEQLIEKEFTHASQHLGGPHNYSGRPLARTHRPHRINRGQFHRRLWIVEQTLHDHQVPQDIIDAWLNHERKLAQAITQGRQCVENTQETPSKET